jgi:hypothetical protein
MEPTQEATPHAPETAGGAALWEDMVDIIVAPADVFRRRRNERPVRPLLMLLAAALAVSLALIPVTRPLMIQAAGEAGAAMEQWSLLMGVMGAIFTPIGMLFTLAIMIGLLWLFTRPAEPAPDLRRLSLVAIYPAFIGLLGMVVGGMLSLLPGQEQTDMVRVFSVGVLRFLPDGAVPDTLAPVVGLLDVFAIWGLALVAVGLVVLAGVNRTHAILAAIGTWLLMALPGVVVAAMSS